MWFIFQELLKIIRSEYVIVDDSNELKDESFVYLVFAHSSLSDLKIYVDTVGNFYFKSVMMPKVTAWLILFLLL